MNAYKLSVDTEVKNSIRALKLLVEKMTTGSNKLE